MIEGGEIIAPVIEAVAKVASTGLTEAAPAMAVATSAVAPAAEGAISLANAASLLGTESVPKVVPPIESPTGILSILTEGVSTTATKAPEFSNLDNISVASDLPKGTEIKVTNTPEAQVGQSDPETEKKNKQMQEFRQLQRESIQIRMLIEEVRSRNKDGKFLSDLVTLNTQLADVQGKLGSLGLEMSQAAIVRGAKDIASGNMTNVLGTLATASAVGEQVASEGV